MSDKLNSWTWYDLLHFWIVYDNDSRKNFDTFYFYFTTLSQTHTNFVDGSVRRILKTSSEIIPKQLRTKHATLEFLSA